MFFKRGSHIQEADISAYLDGELSQARLRDVAAHLSTCDLCNDAVEDMRETKAALAALARPSLPRVFTLTPEQAGLAAPTPPNRFRALAFAPAVSFVLLVGLLLVDLTGSGGRSNDEMASSAMRESANDSAAGTTMLQPNTGFSPLQPQPAIQDAPAIAPPPVTAPQTGAPPMTGAPENLPASSAPTIPAPAIRSAPATGEEAGASSAVLPPSVGTAVANQTQAPVLGAPSTLSAEVAPPQPPSGATADMLRSASPATTAQSTGMGGSTEPAATPQIAAIPAVPITPPATGPSAPIAPVLTPLPETNPAATVPQLTPPVAEGPQQGMVPAEAEPTITVMYGRDSDAQDGDEDGISVLRMLQIAAAFSFLASVAVLLWPRLIRKDPF